MPRAARKAPINQVEPALVAEVERAVRQALFLAHNKLTLEKLTAEATAELGRLLVARGLESTAKGVRVPVHEQLLALLKGGGRVPQKGVARRIRGATAAEITAAIDRLVRAGEAHVVVRTQADVLVGGGESVLAPAEIAALDRAEKHLADVLKKVGRKPVGKAPARSLLREDLAALLVPLAELARPATEATSAREVVAEALHDLEDPALKLVRIPALVRSLAGRLSTEEVHRALAAAAEAGAIELRPEAGGEFLAADDSRLCPPGPRGTVFTFARRL